jgi:hypothetical protein
MADTQDIIKALQEMIFEFKPATDPDYKKQTVPRTFTCADPQARRARMLMTAPLALMQDKQCALYLASTIEGEGIAPKDIELLELSVSLVEGNQEFGVADEWRPILTVEFRPTNGWTPGE